MIEDEHTYCIYCRGLLLSDLEIEKQYHSVCRQDFKIGTSNFEYFNEQFINEFIVSVSKDVNRLKILTLSLALLTSIFYVLSILLYPIIGGFSTCILFLVSIYFFALLLKNENLKHFCDFILLLQPQCQYLNKNYCLVLKNGVFLISKMSMFDFFDGFYIVKFPDPYSIVSTRLKLPSNPLITFDPQITNPIKFAISEKMCQIPYNNRQSIKGMSFVVFIQNNEFSGSITSINRIITTLNSPQILQNYSFTRNSIFLKIRKLLFPIILISLLIFILLTIKNLSILL